MKKLYEDNSSMVFEEEDNIHEDDKKDYIVYAEFDDVIKHFKNNNDEIPAKLIKFISIDFKNELYKICNEICLSRKIIKYFEKGIVGLIPKIKEDRILKNTEY